jgi:hypothetical protein
MIGALLLIVLAVAFARVAKAQRVAARDIADLAAIDKRFRRAAKIVRVVGRPNAMVALGIGSKAADTYELAALAFEVVTETGERIAIEAGAKLRAIVAVEPAARATFTGNVLRVPADTRLLARMPPLVRDEADPVAQVIHIVRGEPVTLLDPAVDLFAFVRRTRIASAWKILGLFGFVLGVVLADYQPVIVAVLVVMLVDQMALRGTGFALACTTWRDAEYWKQIRR